MTRPLRVLFVCVENSCRSQIAEAFARRAGAEAWSAGSRPSGRVNPKAIDTLAEIGYDLATHASKGIDDLPPGRFDAVVSMGCGDACPHVDARAREDWSIPDPKDLDAAGFRKTRDRIGREVLALLERLAEPSAPPP